jgi:hypothetical protein
MEVFHVEKGERGKSRAFERFSRRISQLASRVGGFSSGFFFDEGKLLVVAACVIRVEAFISQLQLANICSFTFVIAAILDAPFLNIPRLYIVN